MKAIIFAGGAGTRLWPLSRRNSPKQFEKVIGNKSTLQLAAERLLPDIEWKDIYISTSDRYVSIVKKQLPMIPFENIICEPETRDVGPAVGLVIIHLLKKYPNIPIVILWSDHVVRETELFKKILITSEKLINQKKDKIIFIGQKPRFASQNLGWVKLGEKLFQKEGIDFYSFENFYYRPELSEANKYMREGHHSWNVGYFVTTPNFLWKLFRRYQIGMYKILEKIYLAVGKDNFRQILKQNYHLLPRISFDNAILEKISTQEAMVVSENLGWSDVGAWEALKEALQTSPDQNVIQGKVLVNDCRDSLVYNYTKQMVVTIDLDGLFVINTNDVVLICHKNSVPKIKKLVESLQDSENKHLI